MTLSIVRRAAMVAGAAGVALAAPATAASTTYSIRTLTEPASKGLAVTGALSDLVATSKARVLIPSTWRSAKAPSGQLRFSNARNPTCIYDLTYTVRSVLAPTGDASDYVTPKLPAASSRHLLDSGERGNRSFRVVRSPGIGGRVRVNGFWAGVLTRRADIAATGQSAWTEIRVAAISRKGSECHSGTWRESLGPAIGDSLAVAATRLRFTKA